MKKKFTVFIKNKAFQKCVFRWVESGKKNEAKFKYKKELINLLRIRKIYKLLVLHYTEI